MSKNGGVRPENVEGACNPSNFSPIAYSNRAVQKTLSEHKPTIDEVRAIVCELVTGNPSSSGQPHKDIDEYMTKIIKSEVKKSLYYMILSSGKYIITAIVVPILIAVVVAWVSVSIKTHVSG